MSSRLDGRVAVITGAGSGIGRATALRFAAEGSAVVVNDRNPDTAEATAAAITEAGGRASAHAGDVSSSAYVDELVAAAVERHGRLDIMHNNAASGRVSTIADLTDELLEQSLAVTFRAVVYGTRAALRIMLPQRSGSIINTASNAGLAATADRPMYSAAKAAVVNFTRSTALEGGPHGIRANAMCPGPIETPIFARFAPDLDFYARQIPMGRLGRAEDVADLALFLASDESSYISGQAISIDGAMTARLPEPYLSIDDIARP